MLYKSHKEPSSKGAPKEVGSGSIATVSRCPRYVRFSSNSDQIADVPTRRIKCAPAARETACEPQVHPCAEQRSRTSLARGRVRAIEHGRIKAHLPLASRGMTMARMTGRYVAALPHSMHKREEWQMVMEVLLSAVEGREPVRLVHVALTLALQESKG